MSGLGGRLGSSAAGFLAIGACPRSGTTALAFFLNGDQRFLITPEENVIRLCKGLSSLLGTRERFEAKSGMSDRALSPRERWSFSEIRRFNFGVDDLPSQVWAMYDALAVRLERPKPMIIGDKLPLYFEQIDQLFHLAIPIRYLHITRNPFDVANSMLRRAAQTREGKDWWKGPSDVRSIADHWNRAFDAILNQESDERVLHIQYEDLVFATAETEMKLAKFLDCEIQSAFPLCIDPDRHFDRTMLNSELGAELACHLNLESYRRFLSDSGTGRESLAHLDPIG